MSALDQNVSQEMLAEVWQSLFLPGSCLHHLSLKLWCLFHGKKQKKILAKSLSSNCTAPLCRGHHHLSLSCVSKPYRQAKVGLGKPKDRPSHLSPIPPQEPQQGLYLMMVCMPLT